MLHKLFTAEFWAVLASCWSVLATFGAYRMRRWLAEHLERERLREQERIASELQRHNETLKILSQASASTERPTLASLLEDERQDFRLESSEPPPAPMTWDDTEETTQRETPEALGLQQSELLMARTKPKPRPKPTPRPKY